MIIGKIYFNFNDFKNFIPEDSLLKNIDVNNESGEIIISFYTNDKDWPTSKIVKPYFNK
jgi:hypothetical protein